MTGKRKTNVDPDEAAGSQERRGERETPCGPRGPGTPPSNIKCRINAVHNQPASTTAAAYVFSKPFLVLLHDGSLIVLPSRFRSRPLSFFERVFSAVLFRSSIAASFVHRLSLSLAFPRSPTLSSLHSFVLSHSSNFSLLYVSFIFWMFPFRSPLRTFFHSLSRRYFYFFVHSRDPFTRVLLSSTLTFVLFLSVSRWFFHNLSRLYFCTHSFSLLD